jgi:NAD+ diphosphatase
MQFPLSSGNQKKFPEKSYSTLAGFVEPGESFEDAVKREIWEEAGIHVRNVRYHSGQPWVRFCDLLRVRLGLTRSQPYPANIMVGFYAIGDPLEPIRTDLDNELEGSYTRMSVPNSP